MMIEILIIMISMIMLMMMLTFNFLIEPKIHLLHLQFKYLVVFPLMQSINAAALSAPAPQ